MCKKRISERPMKKIATLFFCIIFVFLTTSCSGVTASAHSLLYDFIASYGAAGVLYSPLIPEGEAGYATADFFIMLFAEPPDKESDYAVFLSSSIDTAYEAAVFICRDESSVKFAERLCRGRLRLLSDMGFGDSGLLLRRGDVIFYSTFPDAERAERIFCDLPLYR